MDYHLAQLFSNSFFYELHVQSIHSNIPLCKTERKLTINITTLYNSITSHQKYLLVKKIPDKKKIDLVRKSLNWLIMHIARSVHDFNDDC